LPAENDCAYVVYILENSRGDSYPGMTNNLERRLRQHNAEITGGAQVTVATARAGFPWRVFGFFDGFRNEQCALRFEAALRHMNRENASDAFKIADGLARKKQYRGVSGHVV